MFDAFTVFITALVLLAYIIGRVHQTGIEMKRRAEKLNERKKPRTRGFDLQH